MKTTTTTKTKTVKKKKKVCIVTWFNCLRCIKLSIGLWLQKDRYGKEYEIELITKYEGFALVKEMGFDHIYNNVRFFENENQLVSALKKSDADIFWCHNEPDLMAQLSLFLYKGKRIVIHDCHDLPSLHYEEKSCPSCKTTSKRIMHEFEPQEKIVCTDSDYVFVPTPTYRNLINQKHGKDIEKIIQVNSCSPSIFFPDYDLPRVGGFLYCGQVNVPEMNSKLRYRDCMPLFDTVLKLGIPAHIYHTTPQANLEPYFLMGCMIHGTLRMFSAIHQYTRFDYGFVGSNVDCQEIQICMPNKLWDCMAAGIPLISLNAGVAGEFIEKNDIGINIQGLNNLINVPWIRNNNGSLINFDFWEHKRENMRKIRYDYTAEKEIRKAFDIMGV